MFALSRYLIAEDTEEVLGLRHFLTMLNCYVKYLNPVKA